MALTHQICRNLSQVAAAEPIPGRPFQPPYLVIIDFGNPERARFAGRGALAPRLNDKDWQRMMEHIIALSTPRPGRSTVCGRLSIRTPGAALNSRMRSSGWPTISRTTSPGCVWTPDISITPGWIRSTGWIAITTAPDYLHFKDVDPQVYQRAIHEGIDFFTACAEGVMCPLGSGAIDYPAIKDFLARRGYQGWITLEQERDPRHAAGSLQAVTESLRYLRDVGF